MLLILANGLVYYSLVHVMLFLAENYTVTHVVTFTWSVCVTGMSLCIVDDRWDFIGSTVATTDYVRLTPDQQSRKGGIWNNLV